MRRIALFSDIHGEPDALLAVLADIDAAGINERYCLGDLIGYGPEPARVIDIMQSSGVSTIIGNYDDGIAYDRGRCGCFYANDAARTHGEAAYEATRAAIDPQRAAWLRSLPTELRLDVDGVRVLLVHGSPRKINEYLLPDRPAAHLARLADAASADVVCVGHIHMYYHRTVAAVSGGTAHFVSDGSVSRPKDGDIRPSWTELVFGSPAEVAAAADDAQAGPAGAIGTWLAAIEHRVGALSGEVTVTFQRPDVAVRVPAGTTLLRAAQIGGVAIDAVCGGTGRCGRCRVIAEGILAPVTGVERELLSDADLAAGVRLACRARALGAVAARVPSAPVRPRASAPGAPVAESLAQPVRLGAAIDLGTTTTAASLVDLRNGRVLASGQSPNPQSAWGADVLSRVAAALRGEAEPLQRAVVGGIEALVLELAAELGAPAQTVRRIALAGNTAMRALALGEDVAALAATPYEDAPVAVRCTTTAALGMRELRAAVYVVPGVSAFIGGDVVAGVLATRLAGRSHPALLLDLGTNGEIVLSAGGTLSAASAAAGPALEGGNIEMGMRATAGAVERINLVAGRLEIGTVGAVPAIGVCGSGLIDLVAALLDAGVIDPIGRLIPGQGLLAGRVHQYGDQLAFRLAESTPVLLTQRDIRELQLAKGAIRAAIDLLLAESSLDPADVPEVIVAGGFGMGVSGASLARIGMLPAEWAQRITFAGNTSLAGAVQVLAAPSQRASAELLASKMQPLALAGTVSFQERFIAALNFPGM